MTEFNEGFVPPDLALQKTHSKNDCPFCQEETPDGAATVYEGSPATLRDALGEAPVWKCTVAGFGEITSVANAHHLIPAEETLHGEQAHDESHPSGNVLPKHAIIKYMSESASGS
ncbi:MAG TPA: hypothetical protein VL025_18645, partial [Thermoanaerobaculia bacterium]|nr:hypothetical protein [Thermoanaerobaculia bacterium]